jgi:hypothetical protein
MSENRKSEDLRPEAGGPCERCGSPQAEVQCGGKTLCLDCYYLAGSCCLEFGADDLWREVEAAR